MTLSFRPVGEDSIEFVVTLDADAWIGIGLTDADVWDDYLLPAVSMTGNGGGADVVTCSRTGARRHWVVRYGLGSGAEVPQATCTQESGRTTMRFRRTLAADGRRLGEVPVRPGVSQQVIYARGDDGEFDLRQHSMGRMRGGQLIDFSSGESTMLAKRPGEVVLMLHLGFMSIAWGALIPAGVIIAKRFGALAAWFKWHRGLQMLGWLLQAVGFTMALLYGEEHSEHFHGLHAWLGLFVVTIGTLQPVNGLLRPHKPAEGEETSSARAAWELVHKGLGWTAVILGVLNMIVGCLLLVMKDYDAATVGSGIAFAAICLLAPAGTFVYSFFLPKSK